MIELERPGRLILLSETLAFARLEISRYSLAGEALIKFCLWPPAAARGAQAASTFGEAAQPIVILARPATVLLTANEAGGKISLITFDGQAAEIEVYAPDAALVAQRLDALLGGAATPLQPNPPPGL